MGVLISSRSRTGCRAAVKSDAVGPREQTVMPYSFLLVSFGSSGNLNPLLTAGRRLRRKGHRVRVLADPAMGDEVKAADFEFASWRRAPIGSDADPSDFSNPADWL